MTRRWLFSAPVDLALFGGTALISLLLLTAGPTSPSSESPEWAWIVGVLLVDIAHVWSTAFIVYFDPAEWRRRPLLYGLTPVAAYAGGVALHAYGGAPLFWRVVAYLAVFHFVRQQYGWVMMYRNRNGERDRLGRWIDGAMIYAATVYPLIVWHCSLPRSFAWMKKNDFIDGAPEWIATIAGWLYLAIIAAYLARAVVQRPVSWGKHLVVASTAACWYVGIVATNSDYAFTVTNVFIHGVPYLALVYVYVRAAAREPASAGGFGGWLVNRRYGIIAFLATLWAIAYVEELLWDRAVWHERSWLFGSAIDLGSATFIAPLLTVPQLVHYFLDGFLWRRQSNPRLGRLL